MKKTYDDALKIDPITGFLVRDGWTDVYKQFEKIVNENFPNESKIRQKVDELYKKHKGDKDWDEAYRRWKNG